jgi:hypothetical protein
MLRGTANIFTNLGMTFGACEAQAAMRITYLAHAAVLIGRWAVEHGRRGSPIPAKDCRWQRSFMTHSWHAELTGVLQRPKKMQKERESCFPLPFTGLPHEANG